MRCRRGVVAAVTAVVLSAGAAGCARIPDEGPVSDGSAPAVVSSAAPFDFAPPGPDPGATPDQVVSGFLTALQATPMSTDVARRFLTDRAAAAWHPERRTLLYREQEVLGAPVRTGQAPVTVPVALRGVFALDETGRWSGPQAALERSGLRLSLVRDGGEWRIADPPDALVLPLTHFENRYRRFAVHFADPTGTVLVPEPVYLPVEVQTPTQLVEALLAGPTGVAREVDRTYLPPGTELVVSVPVGPDGVAQVPLTEQVLELGPRELTAAAAQLVWTLRQVPDVIAVRITADGEPLAVPGFGDAVPVDALQQYSPLVAGSSTDLYGVRGGVVRRVDSGQEAVHLRLPTGLRPVDLAVGLTGEPVAVADAAGRVQVLARAAGTPRARVVSGAATGPVTDLRWDWSRSLWVVPRRWDGTVTVLVGDRVRPLPWRTPGLRGRRVAAAALSRDGSRLVVALTGGGAGVQLLQARVVRSGDDGTPVALSSVGPIRVGGTGPGPTTVAGLGWRDEQTLAVLTHTRRQRSRVLGVPVDGQRESGVLVQDGDVLFGRATDMTTSPTTGEVRVTTQDGNVHTLTLQWRTEPPGARPLRLATYVG